MIIKIFIALALVSVSLTENRTTKLDSRANIDIEYFYGVNNDKDGDFIISQLAPELKNPSNSYLLLTFPIGGIQIIMDDVLLDKYYCTAKDSICETSLIHYCVEMTDYGILVEFLKCYFQSELYPVDLVEASQQCFLQYDTQTAWDRVLECSKNEQQMINFARTVLDTQMNYRPTFEQTPHIFLGDYSALAAIDLKKAICRVTATDIWQCESVGRYKEPKAEIYYTVYDQVASEFFLNQFTHAIAQNVIDTTVELDIIPNPNKIMDCNQADDSCWSHKAHWCIYLNQGGITQVETIQCTFGKSSSISAQDRVQQCAPNIFTEIKNCVDTLGQSNSIVKGIQSRFNLLVEQSQQQAVEVIINDKSNVKARNGILQELCYNYFEIDNETLGCKVTLPKVQIFYESQNSQVARTFNQIKFQAQYAPFDTMAQFEFIPYGQTTYQNGNYTCPQGEHQCEANWFHACLFDKRFSTVDQQYLFIKFFSCATANENKNPLEQAVECLNQVYNDGPNLLPELIYCAHSDDLLKEQLRTKTEAITLSQAPEILINGIKKTSDVALDIITYLCGTFNPIKPRVCFDIENSKNQTLQLSVFLTADTNSQSFVQSQIKPLLTTGTRDSSLYLLDVIEWNFVPWGPSVYNSTSGVVDCANGDEECLGNRILACATRQRQNGKLGIREDKLRVVSFVVCFFDSANWQTNPLEAASLCSPKLSPLDNYPQLYQCAVQNNKLKLLLNMKTLTDNNYPTIVNFPAVSIDNHQQSSTNSLQQSLCAYYQATPMPTECINVPPPTNPPGGAASTSRVSSIILTLFSIWLLYNACVSPAI